MLRRPLWILALGAALGCAVPACVGGTEDTNLNPQPLPPEEPGEKSDDSYEPGSDRGAGGSSSSSGGSSGGTTSAARPQRHRSP